MQQGTFVGLLAVMALLPQSRSQSQDSSQAARQWMGAQIFPKNGNVMTGGPTSQGPAAPGAWPQTIHRPMLQKGAFGFSLANHLNPRYLFEDGKDPVPSPPPTRPGAAPVAAGGGASSQGGVATGIPVSTSGSSSQDLFSSGACSQSTLRCNDPTVNTYRTMDGSCNNLQNPNWGQAGTPQRRLLPRKLSMINCGDAAAQLPNARAASNLLALRGEEDDEPKLSMYVMVVGQVVDHDIVLTPLRATPSGNFLDCCAPENADAPECCSIKTPPGDFFYGRDSRPTCIPFLRSRLVDFPGNCKVRLLPDVENANTAFIDLSFVYGSSLERSLNLRSRSGGKLLVTADNSGRPYPLIRQLNSSLQMQFGDSRGDVHPAFTMVLTALLRNHNSLASRLQALHPDWDDEKLFQEARKINVALFQHVVYGQWMDALLGTPNDVSVRASELQRTYYKPDVDPRISLIFSTAAYRLHTLIAGFFEQRGPQYEPTQKMRLRDVFHDPLKLVANNTFDELMRGLAAQALRQFNNKYTSEMTEFLFLDKTKNFGLDIVALNIQRGRDHQIQSYPQYRELCGLGKVQGWGDLVDLIPQDDVQLLLHSYRSPDDVDMYVASNMEVPVTNSVMGPTAHCLVREQFERLRDGDRFFYTNHGQFSPAQLASIKSVTLGQILCQNANSPSQVSLPRNVFRQADSKVNPLVPCSALGVLDLTPWA